MKEEDLIFIISQPRAGSTLLQKLLSNNNEVATNSEPWIILNYAHFLKPELCPSVYNQEVCNKGVDFFTSSVYKMSRREYIKAELLRTYSEAKGKLKYFLDKTPRYYFLLEEIFEMFPKARFVVLKRDPGAVLNSMIKTWSANKLNFNILASFKEDFLTAPILINKFYKKRESANNIYCVKYESITAEPGDEIRKLYEWLGISFGQEVIDIATNRKTDGIYGDDVYRKEEDDSYRQTVINKKDTTWIDNRLSSKSQKFIVDYLDYLGPDFISDYGYNLELPEKSVKRSKSLFNDFIRYIQYKEVISVSYLDFLKAKWFAKRKGYAQN